jgi:hypothetical protein
VSLASTERNRQISVTTEQKRASYNSKMAALFSERDIHPVDSPERTAAVERILALWYAEGS